ncbi:gamma-glutamylcyclotransferase family protein [Aspergillus undulatus]|uniref:gamma-glutamylcyclotransferase family protein n=1 Tax=Aspergillus undulatus TaxID=1810928 RepID=UPI003CCE3943
MGDHVLFFYGTLMAPQILHRVIHGSPTPQQWQKDLLRFRPAILHEYRRHRVRYADYPGILKVKDKDSLGAEIETSAETSTAKTTSMSQSQSPSVLGTVVSGLTDGDLHRLDIFEGSQYAREKVSVRILRETLSEDPDLDSSSRSHSNGDAGPDGDADRHLKDVLEAAGAEFADEGEEVEAETYVWIAGREGLENAEWDFEAFKRDKMAWWVAADESEW